MICHYFFKPVPEHLYHLPFFRWLNNLPDDEKFTYHVHQSDFSGRMSDRRLSHLYC
uniref:Uncharacterized protein n=1 Tax=Siphoviridae sp. cttuu15 TaxID=2825709 RepID=A0A8S5U1C6_9CAUD|nr:MAG TPA: hypothetical protein [Siphoviridae sp. cttuu15]